MNINERIRYFRKEILKMNQSQFAKCLGMKQTGVSSFERGTIKDSTIKALRLAFNLNENWIRNGVGSMYNKNKKSAASSNELDEIIDKYGISKQELEFARSYLKLDPDFRHALLECFRKLFYSDKVES